VTISHDLSETLTTSFTASGYIISGIATRAQGSITQESHYYTATPTITWKFLEWWKAELSYTYGRREAADFSNIAMSNATMFMLTYYPPKLAISN
jgi:hypothetical protein